jgi:hypothetical protein
MAGDDRFAYAEWALSQKNDPEPMQKLLDDMEENTRIGRQIVKARKLLGQMAESPPLKAA